MRCRGSPRVASLPGHQGRSSPAERVVGHADRSDQRAMIGDETRNLKWMGVVAVIVFSIGLVVGMLRFSPESSRGPRSVYCQDALARRAQAEQALSRSSEKRGCC